MTPERWARVKEIFSSAQEKPEAERAAFVDEACGTDTLLRQQVQRLLSEQDGPELESPVAGILRPAAPSLATGSMLNHYRVEEKLGEGGMGVVYKAHDTTLGRSVAIKVLREEFSQDRERMARFNREARLLASLNHTNIAAIHGLEESDGVAFLVLEHVPGKTLAQRLARKRVPVREAIALAVQIAEALDAAHEKGIVHRDLKPANIKVTDEGKVKVLDFGIAKALEREPASDLSGTATEEIGATAEGAIVGTIAYMSPEQACGKPLDTRTDIWSFGCVLYEMITGRCAFQGDSKLSTLAAILKEEPKAASQLVDGLPGELERIIKRCLRKNPAQRFQHMSDLKVDLDELKQELDSGVLEAPGPPKPQLRRRLFWPVGLALVLTATLIGIWVVRSNTGTPEAALVPVPLTSYPGFEVFPSFSPDGNQVAFQRCPQDPSRGCDIYVKQIGVEPPVQLTHHPAQEYNPVWSPDGRFIAFFRAVSASEAALILIPQRGGAERVLGNWERPAGWWLSEPYLAWTPDSKWLALPIPDPREGSRSVPGALFLLSVETGERRRLTTPPTQAELWGDTAPAFSPDGRTLVFSQERLDTRYLYLLRLSEDYHPLGEPERLKEAGEYDLSAAWLPSGSEIVFDSESNYDRFLLWRMPIGKRGSPRRLNIPGDGLQSPALSRQGSRLAYVSASSNIDIWRVAVPSPGQRPPAPAKLISSTRDDWYPQYSPDGKKIAFASNRSGSEQIWVCDPDGSNAVQLTFVEGETVIWQRSWSPGGDRIAYAAYAGGKQHIYVISSDGGPPARWTSGQIQAAWPKWSRDGRWLYFDSAGTI